MSVHFTVGMSLLNMDSCRSKRCCYGCIEHYCRSA